MKKNMRMGSKLCFIVCFSLSLMILVGLDEVNAASQESIKSFSKKKVLSAEVPPKLFQVDKKAIHQQQKRLELTYLTRLLRDPASLAAKIILNDPNRDADKVIKDLVSRKNDLIKDLINDSKKILSSEEALVTQGPLLRPPPGDEPPLGGIGKIDSLSLRDALEGMGILTADAIGEKKLQQLKEQSCGIRQGRVTDPEYFRVIKDLLGDGTAEGNIAYNLDNGALPFHAYLKDDKGPTDTYIMMSELGFTFPAPLCDSTLSWEFELRAHAELSCGAEVCMVYMDHYIAEQPDVSQAIEALPIMTAGALLEIIDSSSGRTEQITVSGSFDVASQTESRISVLTIVSLWARDGLAITDGTLRINSAELGGLLPGVRYRFDPKE